MAKIDKTYHDILLDILQHGYKYEDPNRKNVQRLEIPSYTFRHEFKDGFPAITTKKLHYKNVVTELIWFLRGDTNIKYLIDNGCNIWNKDAYNNALKHHNTGGYLTEACGIKTISDYINVCKQKVYSIGDLGPIYGHQWRKWSNNGPYYDQPIDQIQRLITNLKEKPLATDHIVNSWNVGDLSHMALPPCHDYFQVVVRPLKWIERHDLLEKKYNYNLNTVQNKYKEATFINFKKWLKEDADFVYEQENIPKYGFELHWHQRSCDLFLGIPFNISSYATLALILEKITGYKALAIQGDLKKVHLYDNSFDAVKEQLSRDVDKYKECNLNISHLIDIDIKKYSNNLDMLINRLKIEDFKLENYESYPHIKVEMLERNK